MLCRGWQSAAEPPTIGSTLSLIGCSVAGSRRRSSSDPYGCLNSRFVHKAGSTKMTQTNTITAGIDTSKHKLDIAVHGSGKLWQVENAISGWRRLATDLAKLSVTRVGIEASGGYEQGVVQYLRGKGLTVLVLQPLQVRSYARAHLRRAKNDRLDAVLIADCTAHLIDKPRIAADPRLTALAGAASDLCRTARGGHHPSQDAPRAHRRSTSASPGPGRHRLAQDPPCPQAPRVCKHRRRSRHTLAQN